MGANCTSVSHLLLLPRSERATEQASKLASPTRHNPLTLVPIRAQRRRTKRRSRRAQGKGCDAKAFVVVLTRNSGEEIVNGRGGGSRNLSPVLTRDMEGSHAAIPPSWEPDCLIYNPRRAKSAKQQHFRQQNCRRDVAPMQKSMLHFKTIICLLPGDQTRIMEAMD